MSSTHTLTTQIHHWMLMTLLLWQQGSPPPQGPWGYLSRGVMWQGCVCMCLGWQGEEWKEVFFIIMASNQLCSNHLSFVLQMTKKTKTLWPRLSVPKLFYNCLETTRMRGHTDINVCLQRKTWKHFLSWFEVDRMNGKRPAHHLLSVCDKINTKELVLLKVEELCCSLAAHSPRAWPACTQLSMEKTLANVAI